MRDWSHDIARRLRSLRLRPEREAEIVEELADHLDDRSRELTRSGMSESSARKRALDEMVTPAFVQGLAAAEPSYRGPIAPGISPTGRVLADLVTDVRIALRGFRRERAFTLVFRGRSCIGR